MAQMKVGRNFFKAKTNEEVIKKLTASLLQQIVANELGHREADGPKVAAAMQKAAVAELNKLGPFIASNLIDRIEGRGKSTDVPESIFSKGLGGSLYDANSSFADREGNINAASLFNNFSARGKSRKLTWPSLSLKTEKEKGHSRFFKRSGDLQRYFNGASQDILDGVGIPTVKFRKKRGEKLADRRSRLAIYGSLNIRIAPRVTPAGLPSLASGNWASDFNKNQPIEKRIFPQNVFQKLHGPSRLELQRPLFQPALGFWLLFRVPTAISRAMQRAFERYQ